MTGTDLRVLVTGSRTWRDLNMVMRALDGALANHLVSFGITDVTRLEWSFTVVHGGALGADTAAHFWVRKRQQSWGHQHVRQEVIRPDYESHGKGAPWVRNTAMAASGVSRCYAFLMPCERMDCNRTEPHPTHGAEHCVGEAERYGVPVTSHHPGTVI